MITIKLTVRSHEDETVLSQSYIGLKSVSTNQDECTGVGHEISTCSKRKTLEIEKI